MKVDVNTTPWLRVQPLAEEACVELRRRAIFECCKWDPHVEDMETLAPMAVVLKRSAWRELQAAAEALAAETTALEEALVHRPDLHRALALPRPIRKVLACRPRDGCQSGHVRVMRFDFHPTAQGWRVSEVNTDVPGGYNEASAWTHLVAEHVAHGAPVGDPAGELAEAISKATPPEGAVALVHATAYSDDRQVMAYLARRLERCGVHPVLAAPDHLEWHGGCASIKTGWFNGPVHFVFRFFPAEWLPNLDRHVDWSCFFGETRTPLCNPATALLTQSKRWPLVADKLGLEMPTWEQLLPETRDPRDTDWQRDQQWVIKPALGRVGELIGLQGVTSQRDWKMIRRAVRWGARHWVAQRRFRSTPLQVEGQSWHICFGVYTINGRAAGIYGRIAAQPLINHVACDTAVLVEPETAVPAQTHLLGLYESVGTL